MNSQCLSELRSKPGCLFFAKLSKHLQERRIFLLSVKILAVKASSTPPTLIIPRPQMSQLKKLYSTDPLDIADDPLSFVPTEILHFEEAYDKRFENTSVTAIAVKQKPSTALSCVKPPEHFAQKLLKPIQSTM